ncbi:MAG: rhomboid family intramembrane serine protease, partial [Proteobacteria bacterium]|nr:rhomboid family intramembrane serine protease [Pseudomonadota bacterium]
MFLIPIFNEDFEFKRLPYITITLILLNTIIFFFTSNIVSHQMDHLGKVATKLNRTTVQLIIENKAPEYFNKNLIGFHESTFNKIAKDSTFNRNSDLYTKWSTYYNEYKSMKKNSFYNKWGVTPAHLNIITLITAMFIHVSFFHLFFNMLFLWLVGLNIEDDWGRIVFVLLYLVGGIFSSLIYAGMSGDKGIPLIGASGAISVIMGAFMVRHFKTRIRYFYFILLIFYPIWGIINIPAYVVLPFWFLEQIFGASMSAHANGGVAYWAHIGGFLFG